MRSVTRIVMCVVLLSPAAPARAADAGVYQLANQKLKVCISGKGELLSVDNHSSSEEYRFESDGFELDTDLGSFSNRDKNPTRVQKEKNRLVYEYDFGKLRVDLIYTLKGDNGFIRRRLKIANDAPLRLELLSLGKTRFARPADEVIHYMTFWMAPTVEFIRYEKGGMFTGIENPFYKADLDEEGVALSFEPGLILKAGEGYESEPQFIGVYRKSGVMIEDSQRYRHYQSFHLTTSKK